MDPIDQIRHLDQIHRIVLTGFMGSGKTTVGLALAELLKWRFADLDDAVAVREGLSVPLIFASRGEAVFRQGETAALAELLRQPQLVVALGGGAPETTAVAALLRAASNTAVVHLQAPFDLLYARCLAQAEDPHAVERPLLGERQSAAERYAQRMAAYTGVSHIAVDAAAATPAEVAGHILATLEGRLLLR